MNRKEAKQVLAKHGISNRFSLRTVTIWDRSHQVLTIKDWDPETQTASDDLVINLEPHRVRLNFEPVPGYVMATETTMYSTRHYFGKVRS